MISWLGGGSGALTLCQVSGYRVAYDFLWMVPSKFVDIGVVEESSDTVRDAQSRVDADVEHRRCLHNSPFKGWEPRRTRPVEVGAGKSARASPC